MGVTCSMHGEDEKCVQNFTTKPEGKRLLGTPRCRWGGYGLDLIGWEYGQVVGSCGHGNELLDSVKGGEFLNQLSECCMLYTFAGLPDMFFVQFW